jgi:hypothetical protein
VKVSPKLVNVADSEHESLPKNALHCAAPLAVDGRQRGHVVCLSECRISGVFNKLPQDRIEDFRR